MIKGRNNLQKPLSFCPFLCYNIGILSMEVFMSPARKSYCTKRLLLFCILFSVLFAAFYAWYTVISADALFAGNILVDILFFAYNCMYSLFFSVIIGYLVYGLYRFGLRGSVSLFLVALEMLLFYHFATLVAMALPYSKWIFEGLPTQFLSVLADLLLEILIFAILIFISFLVFKSAKKDNSSFSMHAPFALGHPIRLCSFIGAFLLFLPTLLNNLLFEIDYGLPTSFTEWLQFLLYWLQDLFIFLILPYFTAQFIAYRADKK